MIIKDRLYLYKIVLVAFAMFLNLTLQAQVLNPNKTFEVHFLQGFGFINTDPQTPNNVPDQTFQMLVAKDNDNQPTQLLNYASGAANPSSYCYHMQVDSDIWGPAVDFNLALIGGNSDGKFDFDIYSWEEDIAIGDCQYTSSDASPGYKNLLISTSDSVNAVEWRTDTLDIPNSPNPSKARIKYTWRYNNGQLASPLDFGNLDINSTKKDLNSNRAAPVGGSDPLLLGYQNDWDAQHSNFRSAPDVTYTFELTRLKSITISTVSSLTDYDTYLHLVKLDANGAYMSYIEGNDDAPGPGIQSQLTSSLSAGKYAIIVEGFSSIAGVFELSVTSAEKRLYVNNQANGNGDGSTWSNAYTDLQDALLNAIPEDTIWVAKGTYLPATSDRDSSFVIPDSVQVYGGFAGNEASNYDLDLRNFTTNETILSGDIGTQNYNSDNSYHVVHTKNVSSETVVDGVTITKGNANALFPKNRGGGWLNDGSGTGNSSNPTLANCTFTSNTAFSRGGAMYNNGFNNGISNPTLANCTFASNTAGRIGGAMFNDGENGVSSPVLTNCTFTSNTANIDGGAMGNVGFDGSSNPTLTNCTFASNTANNNGGAMYNIGGLGGNSDPILTNCTFASNTANNNGGAMYNDEQDFGASNPTLTNCILWGNMAGTSPNSFYNGIEFGGNATVTISYSLVEEADCNALDVGDGNVTCSGNMIYAQDPQFVDADNSILNLKCNSPAINTGTSTGGPTDDITGFARTANPDMGAYEFGYMIVDQPIVDAGDPDLSGVPFVTAKSKIENTNDATYRGARYVELLPGFEVAPTSGQATVFRAEVGGGCSM